MTPAEHIALRESEIANYDQNIATYSAILATLPTEWPARLQDFQNRTDQHKAITECDEADAELLGQLLYAKQLQNLIRTEKHERMKSAAILATLQA